MTRLILAAALLLAGACKGDEPEQGPKSNRPVPISEPERARGKTACETYAERACACAKTMPAVQRACDMAAAQTDAFQLALETDDNPKASPSDVANAQKAARDVVTRCIADNTALDTQGCP